MFVWIASIPLVVLGVKKMPKWVWALVVLATGMEVHTGSVPAPFVRTQFQEDVSVEDRGLISLQIILQPIEPI